ncbi:guanine nucleotide exchange factor DBS isoform X5 [Tachysurus ichikawai]
MLCWLEEEEMSVQEFLERVGCVITHVDTLVLRRISWDRLHVAIETEPGLNSYPHYTDSWYHITSKTTPPPSLQHTRGSQLLLQLRFKMGAGS